jgi:hypothetical protein
VEQSGKFVLSGSITLATSADESTLVDAKFTDLTIQEAVAAMNAMSSAYLALSWHLNFGSG